MDFGTYLRLPDGYIPLLIPQKYFLQLNLFQNENDSKKEKVTSTDDVLLQEFEHQTSNFNDSFIPALQSPNKSVDSCKLSNIFSAIRNHEKDCEPSESNRENGYEIPHIIGRQCNNDQLKRKWNLLHKGCKENYATTTLNNHDIVTTNLDAPSVVLIKTADFNEIRKPLNGIQISEPGIAEIIILSHAKEKTPKSMLQSIQLTRILEHGSSTLTSSVTLLPTSQSYETTPKLPITLEKRKDMMQIEEETSLESNASPTPTLMQPSVKSLEKRKATVQNEEETSESSAPSTPPPTQLSARSLEKRKATMQIKYSSQFNTLFTKPNAKSSKKKKANMASMLLEVTERNTGYKEVAKYITDVPNEEFEDGPGFKIRIPNTPDITPSYLRNIINEHMENLRNQISELKNEQFTGDITITLAQRDITQNKKIIFEQYNPTEIHKAPLDTNINRALTGFDYRRYLSDLKEYDFSSKK
ncbi:3144_t:CDS:2 [Acaulospora morrowiae]|uniref:3144_t:CDS:1 n=1 Tax=Acaulospora morrowiae TaxID=94023 RepID=A0A9N8W9X8_9GLOM|nr:3144_t:CDS:2 [Acaulospora morrowiae]